MKGPAQCAGLNKLSSASNMPKIPNPGQVLVAIKKQDIFIFLIFCKVSIFLIFHCGPQYHHYTWLNVAVCVVFLGGDRGGGGGNKMWVGATVTVIAITYCPEYWMIYRGPGFLVVGWFASTPTFSPSPVSKLDQRHTGRLKMTPCWQGGRSGRGAESCDHKKAWFSMHHSILSGVIEIRWKIYQNGAVLMSRGSQRDVVFGLTNRALVY